MSDLFISEILVLVLLLPVLLRPFFRRLQRIEGIAVLPLLSLLLCAAVIAGTGLRVSFVPVLLFSVLLFLSGIARMVRLFLGLPTDWFSPLSAFYAAFLLLVYSAVLVTAFVTAPENSYSVAAGVRRSVVSERVSAGIAARYTELTVSNSSGASMKPVVLFLGDISSGAAGRTTAGLILAESGYTVLSADFTSGTDFDAPLLSHPAIRTFISLAFKIGTGGYGPTNADEVLQAQSKELVRLDQYARRRYGAGVPVYVVSEGSGSLALLARMKAEPALFAGAVCIVPEDFAGSFSAVAGGYRTVTSDSGPLPADAGSAAVLAVTGDRKQLPGFGELGADDVLAAFMLGAERDTGRRNAELTGRRIASWLAMRRAYENR